MRDEIAEQMYLCAGFHHQMPPFKVKKWENLPESVKDVWRGYSAPILAHPAPGWVVKCGNLGNECNHEWALANCVGTLPIPDRCIRPATLKEVLDGQGVRG